MKKIGSKPIIVLLLVLLLFLLQVGCTKTINDNNALNPSSNNADKNVDIEESKEIEIMNEFDSLINKDSDVLEVIEFIGKNISNVSKESASSMIIILENSQKKNFLELENKYYEDSSIQEKLYELYLNNYDLNSVDDIEDENLKALLNETIDKGFKVETAEGSFFPVIDYSFYKQYSSFVTPDIAEYINIKAIDSDNTPIKDAGLVIEWKDIMARALKQEKFIVTYKNSEKIEEIKTLYKRYLSFSLFGSDNTPAFDYNSNILVPELKQSYEIIITSDEESNFKQVISDFYHVLKNNDFKLNEEVKKFRESIINE